MSKLDNLNGWRLIFLCSSTAFSTKGKKLQPVESESEDNVTGDAEEDENPFDAPNAKDVGIFSREDRKYGLIVTPNKIPLASKNVIIEKREVDPDNKSAYVFKAFYRLFASFD